jgi:hypothetical protein
VTPRAAERNAVDRSRPRSPAMRDVPHPGGNTGHVGRLAFDLVRRESVWQRAGPPESRASARGRARAPGSPGRDGRGSASADPIPASAFRTSGTPLATDPRVGNRGDSPEVIPNGPKPQERDRMKNAGRARRGVNRQGREKRRRRSEAGVEARDEESGPPGQPSRALSSESVSTVGTRSRVRIGVRPRSHPRNVPGPPGGQRSIALVRRSTPPDDRSLRNAPLGVRDGHRGRSTGRRQPTGRIPRDADGRTVSDGRVPTGRGAEAPTVAIDPGGGRCPRAPEVVQVGPNARESRDLGPSSSACVETDGRDRLHFGDASEATRRSSMEEPFARRRTHDGLSEAPI